MEIVKPITMINLLDYNTFSTRFIINWFNPRKTPLRIQLNYFIFNEYF